MYRHWRKEVELKKSMNQVRAMEHILEIESLCASLRANLKWNDPDTMLRSGFVQIAKRAVRAQGELI